MDLFHKNINLLGLKATDKITGFSGVIDSISFDLYGCIQAVVKPPLSKDGQISSGNWFDISRLEIDYRERVIEVPNFSKGYIAEGRKGPSDKPMKGI